MEEQRRREELTADDVDGDVVLDDGQAVTDETGAGPVGDPDDRVGDREQCSPRRCQAHHREIQLPLVRAAQQPQMIRETVAGRQSAKGRQWWLRALT